MLKNLRRKRKEKKHEAKEDEVKLKNYSNCVPSFRGFNGFTIKKGLPGKMNGMKAYIKMLFVHYNRLL